MSSELSWVECKGSPSMRIYLQRYPCGCIRLQPAPLYIDDLELDSTVRLAVGLNILLLQISGDYSQPE
jgi:hypothetical protein